MPDRARHMPPGSIEPRARDPRGYFASLRAGGPVVTDAGEKLLVEPSLIEPLLLDWRGFSNAGNIFYGRDRPIIPQQVDPPLHSRYRRILNPLMSSRRMAALEPELTARAEALIAPIAAAGACEFKREFAVPFPALSFLRLLGLPDADIPFFLAVKDAVLRPRAQPGDAAAQLARQQQMAAEAEAYFTDVLRARRTAPGDDLISAMMAAEVNGERLTDQEVIDICFQLPLAGLDSVASTLTLGFALLATRPDLQARLAADPAAADAAVDEVLRWETPVHTLKRVATRATELAGCPIAAGERLFISLTQANMDPARFANPADFDITRSPNRQVAFGLGPHTCLGNNLAKVELRVALRAWHARIPAYHIAETAELAYSDDQNIRTLASLQLVLHTKSEPT